MVATTTTASTKEMLTSVGERKTAPTRAKPTINTAEHKNRKASASTIPPHPACPKSDVMWPPAERTNSSPARPQTDNTVSRQPYPDAFSHTTPSPVPDRTPNTRERAGRHGYGP